MTHSIPFHRCMFLLLCSACFMHLAAQTSKISGVVTGAKGEKLSFVTIQILGTTSGTMTDADGYFELETATPCILKVSMVGYQSQTIEVKGPGPLAIKLLEDSQLLDQVVVVGYGTSKKIDLTGASSRIKGSELKNTANLSAAQALQGKAAGVHIINSGAPGGDSKIRIRGVGSILGGADPLYVVDGVITTDIRNLSTNDIVSVDILKDASSTAIYGARAANGVILITTRGASKDASSLQYENQLGVRLLLHSVAMSPPGYYAQYSNDAAGFPAVTAGDVTGSTDWYSEITRPAFFHKHNLNFSGKLNRYQYYLSAGYLMENGMLIDNNYERYTLRWNQDYSLTKDITLGSKFGFSHYNANNKPYALFTQSYIAAPIYRAINADGTFGNTSNVINNVGNPLATLKTTHDRSYGNRYQGHVYLQYRFLEHFEAKTQFGTDIQHNNGWQYIEQYATYQANGVQGGQMNEKADLTFIRDTNYHWVWDNTLAYEHRWGEWLEYKMMVGHTAERRDGWISKAITNNADIPNDESYWILNFNDTLQGQQNFRDPIENYFRRESYFARLNLKIDRRFLVNATFRRDANSNFPASNRWANFPSIGFGWILNEESWFSRQKLLSALKLRVSYGLVGNDVIKPGQFDLRPTERLYTYFGIDRIDGATVLGIVDPNLKWEVSEEFDIGIEFSVDNDRITGEIDYYHKNASDALYTIPYATIGFGNALLTNAADITNQGIDLGLKYHFPSPGNWKHVVGINFNYNQNTVTNVGLGRALNFGSLGNGFTATQTLEGHEIGSFWVFVTDGIFQTDEEVKNYPHVVNTKPGDLKIIDVNGDGIIDNLDRRHIGSYQPDMIGGLSYSVSYKQWDLQMDCIAVLGNQVFNAKKGLRFGSNYNIELDVAKNAWQPGSNENEYPRASNATPYPTDYFVESGSFFRINNISLAYRVDAQKFWSKISQLSCYIAAQNPLLLTSYTGFTPELPGNQNEAGIELNVYPVSAAIYFGINASF